MKRRKGFIFTNKKHSERAIMSVVLGVISLVSLICVVAFSSGREGGAPAGYGITGVLALLFSLIGVCLGIVTVKNKEYYRVFPIMGTVLNLVVLVFLGIILYLGIGA